MEDAKRYLDKKYKMKESANGANEGMKDPRRGDGGDPLVM